MIQQRSAQSVVLRLVPVLMLAAALVLLPGCARRVASSYSPPGELSLDAKFDPGESPSAQTLFALSRVMDREDQGEAILLRLIREYPAFMPAYADLAKLRVDQGRLDDAVEAVNLGLEIDPQDPVLHNNLGVCCLLKDDYEGALAEFSAAAGIAPHITRYMTNKALALGMLGQSNAALDLYSQILIPEEVAHNLDVIQQLSGHAWESGPPEPSAAAKPEPAADRPVKEAALELPPAREEPAIAQEPRVETASVEPPCDAAASPLEPATELVALEPPCSECAVDQPAPVAVAFEDPVQQVEAVVEPEPVVVAAEQPSQVNEPAEVAEYEAVPAVKAVPVVAVAALDSGAPGPAATATADSSPEENQPSAEAFEPIPLTPFRPAYSKKSAS